MSYLLAAIGILSAAAYGIGYAHRPETVLRSVLKTTATGALALIALLAGGPTLLVLGLLCSALGDLALSRPGERAFLIGLGGFAAAHLCYIALFIWLAPGLPPILPGLIMLIYAATTEIWLAPHTGALRWPVRFYVVLITAMAMAALALPAPLMAALLGAAAFVASDTLLAIQLFRLPDDSRWHMPVGRALWALYYGAQLLIVWAILG